jgi:hypothetical protein
MEAGVRLVEAAAAAEERNSGKEGMEGATDLPVRLLLATALEAEAHLEIAVAATDLLDSFAYL